MEDLEVSGGTISSIGLNNAWMKNEVKIFGKLLIKLDFALKKL